MITAINAKKGRGLDELLERLIPQVPEKQRKIVLRDSPLHVALKEYQEQTALLENGSSHGVALFPRPKSILTPQEINGFMLSAWQPRVHPSEYDYARGTAWDDKYWWELEHLGMHVSWLIQNSYDAGYRDFTLTTPAPLESLGHQLKATPLAPLSLSIEGDIGEDLGWRSRGVLYIVTGKVRVRGQCSGLGDQAQQCLFELHSGMNYYNSPSDAFRGNCAEKMSGCTFYVKDQELLSFLAAEIHGTNEVYVLNEDGTVSKLVRLRS